MKQLREAIFFAMFFGFLLYWTSPDANQQYTKDLEKVVAKCFDGGAVTIDSKVYLCGIYDTGEVAK